MEPADNGPRLTFNTRQKTFRNYPEFDDKFILGSNEESATHKFCIEEIEKLNELTIIANNDSGKIKKGDEIRFKYNYSLPETVLNINDTYIIPDILLYFREPYELALKWNRLVAVEIVVSHDLNGAKLEIMIQI